MNYLKTSFRHPSYADLLWLVCGPIAVLVCELRKHCGGSVHR